MGKGKKRAAEDDDGFMPLEQGDAQPARAAGKAGTSQGDEGPSAGPDELSRVVYIGHLPYGFEEKALLGFFSQFGKLTRVRLSRNKKTAKPKHYAFLEFQYPEVAQIATAAMDGYFMFKQKITCKVMRQADVHPQLFQGANRKFRNIPWAKLERQRHDRERTPAEHAKRMAKLVKRDKERAEAIQRAGMDYEYTPLSELMPTSAKKIRFA